MWRGGRRGGSTGATQGGKDKGGLGEAPVWNNAVNKKEVTRVVRVTKKRRIGDGRLGVLGFLGPTGNTCEQSKCYGPAIYEAPRVGTCKPFCPHPCVLEFAGEPVEHANQHQLRDEGVFTRRRLAGPFRFPSQMD